MNSDPHEGSAGRGDQLREEAAFWFARMRGEEAERHRLAFEAWLARGALHRAAYNRIGEIFAAGKLLKREGAASPHEPPRMVRRKLRTAALAGVTVLACWLLVPRMVPSFAGSGPADVQEATRVGEVRRVALTSRASAILDTDTLLIARVGGAAGLARLDRGRVRVAVEPGAPILAILADGSRVSASGAVFDLSLAGAGRVDARVISGTVTLLPQGPAAGQAGAPLALHAGQDFRLVGGTARTGLDTGGSGWPDRVLEFRAARLATLIAEANRYAVIKIDLGAPGLADRRISGRFRVGDPDLLARRLAALLPLRIDRRRGSIVLLPK